MAGVNSVKEPGGWMQSQSLLPSNLREVAAKKLAKAPKASCAASPSGYRPAKAGQDCFVGTSSSNNPYMDAIYKTRRG